MYRVDKLLDKIQKEASLNPIPFSIKNHRKESLSILYSMHKRASDFQYHKIENGTCRDKDPKKHKECQKYQMKSEQLWHSLLMHIDKMVKRYR